MELRSRPEEKYLESRARDFFSKIVVSPSSSSTLCHSIHLRKCARSHPRCAQAYGDRDDSHGKRRARIRIIFISNRKRGVRAIFVKKSRGAIRRIQIDSGRATRIFLSKFSSEENARTRPRRAIKRVDSVGSTYAACSESTNEERIPP